MANRVTSFIRSIFNRVEDGDPMSHGGYIGYWPQRFLPPDVRLSHDEALSLSVVWACVDYISKSLAQCDWEVFDKLGGKRTIDPLHNVAYLLNQRPNKEINAMTLKEAIVMQALVFGDGYWEIQRDQAARPYALHPLPSMLVTPRRNDAGDLYYEVRSDSAGATTRNLAQTDIYHLRGPSLYGFLGESIVTHAARSIAVAKYADDFALAFFGNGTIIGGVLEVTKTLTPKEKEELGEDFTAKHKASGRSHKPLVLGAGSKWIPTEVDAQKSQVVESRRHSVDDICRFFGIPPTVIGHLDKASWNNVEHLAIVTVRDGLGPWAKRMEQEANYKLFGARSPKQTHINLNPLKQGDALTRSQAYQIARRNGVMTANEWRELEGWNSIGTEGDLMLVESNMTILDEDNLNRPEPVAPAAPPAQDPNADPAADPAEDPAEDPTEDPAADPAPVVNRITTSLWDHARRVKARRADLTRAAKTPEEIEANLIGLDAKVHQELTDIFNQTNRSVALTAIHATTKSVTAGVDPDKAAKWLMESA